MDLHQLHDEQAGITPADGIDSQTCALPGAVAPSPLKRSTLTAPLRYLRAAWDHSSPRLKRLAATIPVILLIAQLFDASGIVGGTLADSWRWLRPGPEPAHAGELAIPLLGFRDVTFNAALATLPVAERAKLAPNLQRVNPIILSWPGFLIDYALTVKGPSGKSWYVYWSLVTANREPVPTTFWAYTNVPALLDFEWEAESDASESASGHLWVPYPPVEGSFRLKLTLVDYRCQPIDNKWAVVGGEDEIFMVDWLTTPVMPPVGTDPPLLTPVCEDITSD